MLPPLDFATSGDKVIFVVGHGSQVFHVDRNKAIEVSPVLCAAFTGGLDGQEKILTLRQEDPIIFELFLRWLTSSKIPDFGETVDKKLVAYAKLWMLGDRLLVPRFQNLIILKYKNMVHHATLSQLEDLAKLLYVEKLDGEAGIIKNIFQGKIMREDRVTVWESDMMSEGLIMGQADFLLTDWEETDIFVYEA